MVPTDVRWIVPLVLFFLSSISAICLDPRPTRLLLCYQDVATLELNPCLCTHLVHRFTDIKNIGDQSEFLKSAQKHKEKNPDLKLIASLSGSADDLLKNRNITARKLATALDDARLDGVELNVNFNDSLVQKQSLSDLIKKLIEEFDEKTSNRVKRNYDVIEQQADDVTTVSWSKQLQDLKDSNSSQSRVVRESSENEDEYYDENESNAETSEEKKEGTRSKKEEENAEESFTVFIRLPSKPQTLAKHYDLKQLSKYVDYFVLNTNNISDPAEANLTYHPSRLMGINDVQNADSLVDLLTGLGAAQDKIVIAVPSTAMKFTLKNDTSNMPQSPAVGGPVTLTQAQLCKLMSNGTWTVERDEDLTAPYAFNNKTWIAFDDSTSASIKGKYVLLRELAGIAVMNIEAEDWKNDCTKPGPTILSTLYNTLANIGRKTRAAQLYSLQEQLHEASPLSFAADIQTSPYRVTRVVDRAGDIHVVRRQIKTEFECSRQGYFTHPSGCNRFYRCVKFNQYVEDYTVFEYDCPAGLAFDERYEVCVWPGSLPDGGACQGSSEIAPVPRNRYVCPAVEGYYADPENCRWFFACLDHSRDGVTPLTAYEFRCPFGLVFNEAQLVCDWPWNVQGCGQSGYAGAKLTVGDLYEGRLRPSYATLPDYYVSGGRIQGVNSGLVLGSNLVSIPGVGQYDASGSAYSAFGGNLGTQYESGSSNQYSEALKTGLNTNGAQLYSGNNAQYAASGGAKYAGINIGGYKADGGAQYSTGSAAGSGIQYTANQAPVYTLGGVGVKHSLYSGENTVQYNVNGGYASDYAHDISGAYVEDNSGAYIHDNSGDYVHDDKGYVHDDKGYHHDDKGYIHQKDKYENGGQYVHQYSGTVGKDEGVQTGGTYSSGIGYNSGAYVQNNAGGGGQYSQQYAGIKTNSAYSGSAGYNDSNYKDQYVKLSAVKGHYSGNEANVHISAPLAAGQYSSGSVGYSAYNAGSNKDTSYADNSDGNSGAYVHDDSGKYTHDESGDNYQDIGGKYAEQIKEDRENYLHSSGYSGQTVNAGYIHSGGAYPAYTQTDYSSGYIKGAQLSAQKPVSIVDDGVNYNGPVVTVTTAAPISISPIHPVVSSVSGHQVYNSAQPSSYGAVVGSTAVHSAAHYSPVVSVGHDVYHSTRPVSTVTPISSGSFVGTTPAPPVAYYSPQVSVSTPAPPTVYHSLHSATPSVSPISQYNLPSISTPATPAVYHEVSSVSTPATPIIHHSTASFSTSAPAIVYNAPSAPTPAPDVVYHGAPLISSPKTPLFHQFPTVSTPTPAVAHYSSSAGSSSGSYAYNSVPAISTGAVYHSTESPAVVYNKYSQPVTTTYVASTPKPITYYQNPTVTPAPIYKKVIATPTPAPVFLSNTASAYNYVQPIHQPVVFKSPAPVNYNPYQTGVTSVTTLPYVSNVTPCSLKEHSRYAEHVHLPIATFTPTVEYHKPSHNIDYTYQKQAAIGPGPAAPLAPITYHQPAIAVTPKPLQYQHSYKQTVPPVVPVTPAPEVVHYQSVTPSPPPVQILSYAQKIAPVVPVTHTPQVVHYQSQPPSPPPVRFEYRQPVAPVVPVTPAPAVVQYQHVTPAPGGVRYGYRQPVAPLIPVTAAPEVVHYQSVTPSPPPVQFYHKQAVVPVTPAPKFVQYQSVTPSPPPVRFGYVQPVAPAIPVTPAPEVVHYQPVTPPPAPVKFQYSYKRPVNPVTPSPEGVYYQTAPIPLSTPNKHQYSYNQPIVPAISVTENYKAPVPVTTASPVTYPVPTSTPVTQYSYQTPVQPVAPLVAYLVPKKPIFSYTTVAPVTPVKHIFYNEPVTTLAPSYKKPAVISSYSYEKAADNQYYSHDETYTSKPEIKQQYYQKPAAFSYSYEKEAIKPKLPLSSYYAQQGVYAPATAPIEYGYKEYNALKLNPIVVAPYSPAPTIYSVTTPKCESPAVHVTTSSPVTYYTPTTTTGSVDYGTYGGKEAYRFKTASKVQSYEDSKLPEQYLVEVKPQTESQFDSNVEVNRGYKATVNTGNNIYYQSVDKSSAGAYYESKEDQEKAFENFGSENLQYSQTPSTEIPTIKQVYYTPSTTQTPVIVTTKAYVPQQNYNAESDENEEELDISNEENDDQHLVSQYDSQFGSKSTEYTTAVSSTANLKEGDTIVGVVKDSRSRYTGLKKKKVVVVSRLSDFNPLLVNKLGAQCDCTRVVRKRRPRPKSTTALFEPSQSTTVSYEPSFTPNNIVPNYVESVQSESEAPTVEIRPSIRRRKVHRSTTTTESYSNDVESDSDYNNRRNVLSKQRVGNDRNRPVYPVEPSEERRVDYDNNDPINTKDSEDLMNGNVECKRAGLFRHPKYCNKFYSCDWDKWRKKFTLNVMNCPIHLAYDSELGACNWPSKGPACSANNLLV